jgi:hypothetical protein
MLRNPLWRFACIPLQVQNPEPLFQKTANEFFDLVKEVVLEMCVNNIWARLPTLFQKLKN